MHTAPLLAFIQGDQVFRPPTYFVPVFLVLLVAGALCWLVAAVLGFTRARAFGPSTRWFALAAACMIIYHVQFFVIGIVASQDDNDLVLGIGSFLNLFVVLGGLCAVAGFVQLNKEEK